MALVNLGNSQINSSISKVDSSFSSLGRKSISQIIEEKQFAIQSIPLEQDQLKQSSQSSTRQLIKGKVGEFSSFIDGRLLYDNDVLKATEYEDVMKGDLLFEKRSCYKIKALLLVKESMGQFSMACQTSAHENTPQLQRIEMEQHFVQEEQQFKTLPKIKKTVKEKKSSKKFGKKKV